MILSYYEQLRRLGGSDEEVRQAFKRAKLNSSVYYRARSGRDMRFDTAVKAAEQLPQEPADGA